METSEFFLNDFDVSHEENRDEMLKKYRIEIDFEIREKLIYYINDESTRLCISKSLESEVFRMTHDDKQHADVHRCHQEITKVFYISRLLKKLRIYIEHCSSCQVNQTKRYSSYDKFMSIATFSQSFHIVAMNFIIGFSNRDKYNTLLTIIDKFIRRLLLIAGHSIDIAFV